MTSPATRGWGLARRVWARRPIWPGPDDRFHSVRDYRRMVRSLMARHPRDEAMHLAVGGMFEEVGARLADLMLAGGLADGMALLDLGCGCGRLAEALSARVRIDYLGLDVVPEFLSYARGRCPPGWRFALNRGYALPAADASFDRVAAFSLFTHLLHEESFLYLAEAARVLKPGGAVAFSFLEFADPAHWPVFALAADRAEGKREGPLDVFIERSAIALWARRLGLGEPAFTSAGAAGQTLAVLRKPAASPVAAAS